MVFYDERDWQQYYWEQEMGRQDARRQAIHREMGLPGESDFLNTVKWPGLIGSGAYSQGKRDEFLEISDDPVEKAKKWDEKCRRMLSESSPNILDND